MVDFNINSRELSIIQEMLGMLARKYSQADATDLGIEKAASYSRSVAQGRLNALRVDSFKVGNVTDLF